MCSGCDAIGYDVDDLPHFRWQCEHVQHTIQQLSSARIANLFSSFFLFHFSTSVAFLMTWRNFPFSLRSRISAGSWRWRRLSCGRMIWFIDSSKWRKRARKKWKTKSIERYQRHSIWICLSEHVIDFVATDREYLVFLYSINTSESDMRCVPFASLGIYSLSMPTMCTVHRQWKDTRKTNEKKSIKPKHLYFFSAPFFVVICGIKANRRCARNL